MIHKLVLAIALLSASPLDLQATGGEKFDHEHAAWTTILKAHVRADRFDYKALKKAPEPLDAYLLSLQKVSPKQLASFTRAQRYAFWINAYNAHTIARVVDGYPVDSIRDLSSLFGLRSVFDREFIPMRAHHPEKKNDDLSLNDIEHKILRPRFKDARVHAAINCASISCPPLLDEAFVASKLDEQLEKQMTSFIHDSARNRIVPVEGEVRLSRVFDWFAADFERDAGSVRAYLGRYLPEEQRDGLEGARLGFLEYDWALNDIQR